MNQGAFSFGANHGGVEKAAPIATGDVLVTNSGKRVAVTTVESNIHGLVFLAVNLENGADCVVLEREVAYRSR